MYQTIRRHLISSLLTQSARCVTPDVTLSKIFPSFTYTHSAETKALTTTMQLRGTQITQQ